MSSYYVVEAIKEGIPNFDRKIKGYGMEDAVLTGIETRTSAPVRMGRNENLESTSVKGLISNRRRCWFCWWNNFSSSRWNKSC